MFTVIFEKCADWLLPILGGCVLWYGLHYFVFTPRIVDVDTKRFYAQNNVLPAKVKNCLTIRMGSKIRELGQLEAALYTATMRHVDKPYREVHNKAYEALDTACGVSKAVARIKQDNEHAESFKQFTQQLNFWHKLLTGQ